MNERQETLYIIFGCINLALGFLIAIGALFSSLGFAFAMVLFIEVPLLFGLVGILKFPRLSTAFMIFGCAMIMTYIGNWFLTDFRAGFRPTPFHIGWLGLNLAQIFLSAIRLKHFRKVVEVNPCPH